AFDGKRMIGFCINGIGQWQKKSTAYDAGTGIIPEYRGRGVAKELFAFLESRLKEAGVSQYLLEVLTSNVPAATLYRKLGFVEKRRLAVFRAGPEDSKTAERSTRDVSLKRVAQPDWQLFQTFWDGYPSWQNSIDAVERVFNDMTIIAAYANAECVGYGALFRPAASLMQLVVSQPYRRQRIGSAILAALETSERLKINNIDEDLIGTLAFYETNGYKQVLAQHEMIKTL
ncbi:MAG TPA: GNAT family N-acetyltransferase, partial [Pyrinomonadaceae bacterium]|nr:GNAT family N-acetyltransferase [Pyrinomonadaceae bacterium]